MEGEEGLNTVECLRGRLIAERQASKVANGEADSMGNKVHCGAFCLIKLSHMCLIVKIETLFFWVLGVVQLVELEKKLRDEIELREKAERKLKKLKKKL